MDSRFSHLRQRDTSVSMLRVKMSRRRSQSQKENRDRAVNTRRHLDKLPEMDVSSLDASIAMANLSTIKEKTQDNAQPAKNAAVQERLKQLERWKERKALEKEKEKRDKERKGVFKTGLYHPKDGFTIGSLPVAPAAPKRAKEVKLNAAPPQSSRVTRSMKHQQVEQPLKTHNSNTVAKKAVERSTRNRGAPEKPAPAPASTKSKVCADMRTTRSRATVKSTAPPPGKEKTCKATVNNNVQPSAPKEPEPKKPGRKLNPSTSEEEAMVVDRDLDDPVPVEVPSSFAPEGFLFKPPVGLSSFKFEPLTPRSADAFLTPSSSFNIPPLPSFNAEPQPETCEPSPPKSPHHSPTVAPPTTGSALEPKHDVPYFRSEIASETDRLTILCTQWEPKVEDESIPEEMRDCMRTAIGQARLLMKERFNQFSGLVDDCDLGRGEKITTCTDLQGFWDMVYYQVEDVNKKFDALKAAEGRGWLEEHKPPPRQRKGAKKPSVAPAKPTGAKVAAKSRLAAVKAAMKARQQAAEEEKAAKDVDNAEGGPCLNSEEPKVADIKVFDAGFFQVQSPAKTPGSVRRSSRLSAAVLPQASPCSDSLTPRRVTRRSLALAQTPVQAVASPARLLLTPALPHLSLTQIPESQPDTVNASVCLSPAKALPTGDAQPEGILSPQNDTVATQEEPVSVPEAGSFTPVHSLVDEQEEPAEPVVLPPSKCKSPPVAKAHEPACLSFCLSPCASPSQPPVSSPPAVQGHVRALDSVCCTPDTSVVEEIPGLDFERYLQPSLRGSLSPRETVDIGTPSPMAVDVEMESPRGPADDLLTQHDAAAAVPSVSILQSPMVQSETAASDLLLFTPDLKDRIRQSVCPSDLMMFTPPSNM